MRQQKPAVLTPRSIMEKRANEDLKILSSVPQAKNDSSNSYKFVLESPQKQTILQSNESKESKINTHDGSLSHDLKQESCKKRKPRCDRNKKRKHHHRRTPKEDEVIDDQHLLLYTVEHFNEIEVSGKKKSRLVMKLPDPPKFTKSMDYYKEFYKLYMQNENLMADID